MRKALRILSFAGLFVYAVLMLWLLFGQRLGYIANGTYFELLSGNINIVPLKTISNYASDVSANASFADVRHAVVNLVGNVIMFMPLGFFIPCVIRNTRVYAKHLLFCVLVIVFIELIQLFTLLGSLDIDDLILNLIGTTLGYLIFKVVNTSANKRLED